MSSTSEALAITVVEDTKASEASDGFPILIVEDSVDSQRLIERGLQKAGNEVTCVANGKEALQAFEERFFPIVLTDWTMPEMDGVELCRRLRAKSTAGYIYIILLTARHSTAEIVAGLEAGADDYLVKPFNAAELVARLKTAKRILTLERTLRHANEEIKQLSITDPLTGCFNRGYLTDRFRKELKRAKRYKQSLSLILCDIDNFKQINDTYGHETGNEIIKAFVVQIDSAIRTEVDWVARYGGEEFVVIVPETDIDGALELGERIRKAVAGTDIPVEDKTIRITASFGVVSLNQTTEPRRVTFESLIRVADKHLYESKAQGRNRVIGSTI